MLRALHRWLGVGIAGYLLLASLSGVLLLWMDDYLRWRHADLADAVFPVWPDAAAVAQLASSRDAILTAIGLPREARPLFHLYLNSGEERIAHPLTGADLGAWGWQDQLPAFLFELHAHLLAGDLGHRLVGLFGILMLVGVLSGCCLWWRRRRLFRLRFLLPWSLRRGQLLRSHAAQGAALSLISLLLTVTGIAMVFPDPVSRGLNALLGADGPQRPDVRLEDASAEPVAWAQVLAAARGVFPQASPSFLIPPATTTDPVVVRLRNPGELHPNGRSYVVLDRTGRVVQRIDARRAGRGPAVFDSLYPLHAGKTGWPGYRMLLTVAALSLIFIVLTGLLTFFRSRRAGAASWRAAPQ